MKASSITVWTSIVEAIVLVAFMTLALTQLGSIGDFLNAILHAGI